MIIHWLNTELWGPVWPNTIAPSVWTLAAVVISHVRTARQQRRQHDEIKKHVTAATEGNAGADHPAS